MADIEPVVKMVTVPGEPGVVFALFTQRMGEWWPLDSHSVGGENAVDARVDPGVGGRVYEVTREGVEHDWDADNRLGAGGANRSRLHAGVPLSQATHVEITFRQTADGTEMTLVHDGWEARAADAPAMRESYGPDGTWSWAGSPGSVPRRGRA